MGTDPTIKLRRESKYSCCQRNVCVLGCVRKSYLVNVISGFILLVCEILGFPNIPRIFIVAGVGTLSGKGLQLNHECVRGSYFGS